MARAGPKNTRNACNAARLVAGEHQDGDQAVASWCSRPAPSAEVAANDGSKAVTETPRQTLGVLRRHSSLDMSRSTLWRTSVVLQARPCTVRGVSWSEVATVPKRKSHRGLDLDLSLNSEKNIWKGWKENGGTK